VFVDEFILGINNKLTFLVFSGFILSCWKTIFYTSLVLLAKLIRRRIVEWGKNMLVKKRLVRTYFFALYYFAETEFCARKVFSHNKPCSFPRCQLSLSKTLTDESVGYEEILGCFSSAAEFSVANPLNFVTALIYNSKFRQRYRHIYHLEIQLLAFIISIYIS